MIQIPIGEAHNRLSALLKKVKNAPVLLTRRGKPVGVILSPEEYNRMRQFESYDEVIHLAQSLRESGLKAAELYHATRDELEGKT